MSILLALMLSTANAGWFRDWCERNLVGEDPWPFAEMTTDDLFAFHRRKPDWDITRELVWRYRFGLMDGYERAKFEREFGMREPELRARK